MKHNMEDLLGYMIGPKAENMEIFRSLILQALDDHMYWRRNFHPEDKHVISAVDQSKEGYRKFADNLRDLMFEFLSDAKDGIPFFSPRYVGHMNTDLLLPSLVGYFSAMLYNQNNVSDEASPVTVRLEGEVIDMLLKMVGMNPRPRPQSKDEAEDKEGGWGYLCSGGTAANIYSLWVARNLRTLPIAVRLAICKNPGEDASKIIRQVQFKTAKEEKKTIWEMTAWELLNLPTDQLYLLRAQLCEDICAELSVDRAAANTRIDKLVNPFTIQKLGDYGFRSAAASVFPNESELFMKPWRVYVSENVHYSWTKAADLIGLGQNCIVKVPHLSSFDVNVKELKNALKKDLKNGNWALMVASNFGTTEEGALDNLPKVRKMLNKLQEKSAGTVWWHVDAAYGGYLGAMMRRDLNDDNMVEVGNNIDKKGTLKHWLAKCCEAIGVSREDACALIEMSESKEGSWLSWDELINRTAGMSQADSITMDPHKLGYIPYSAGALLLRRGIAAEVVSCDAPYLWLQDGDPDAFVGRFTLEGSRPGAVAAACWLAHSAIPLDQSGHGKILALSILSARQLYQTLQKYLVNSDTNEQVALLHQPHMNMICYVPYRKNMKTLEEIKDLTIGVVEKLSPTANDREFMAVSTDVNLSTKDMPKKDDSPLFNQMLQRECQKWVKIKVIRSVVMGAYSLNAQTRIDRTSDPEGIFGVYAAYLRKIIREAGKEQDTKQLLNRTSAEFMVMDDDPEVTDQLRGLFEDLWDPGITLPWKHYDTEAEALQRIENHDEVLDMAFLDIDMRGSTSNPQGRVDSGYSAYKAILERNDKVDSDQYSVKYVVFFTIGHSEHEERINQLGDEYPGKQPKVLTLLKSTVESPDFPEKDIETVRDTIREIAKIKNE